MLPGTMRAHSLRAIFDAIFHVLKSGCPRRLGSSLPRVNARGWGERSSGPIEESNDLRSLDGPRHSPDQTAVKVPIPLLTLNQDVPPELPKAALNALVADDRTVDGPGT
jgi:hypothetical protein